MNSSPQPPLTYRWHWHWDYGLLRESPPGALSFEAWVPPEHDEDGLWHDLNFDPFTASMSQITEDQARAIAGEQLLAPADDDRYQRETVEALAAHGIKS
jgi:hypothetical protein